jgi:hypothetical protein
MTKAHLVIVSVIVALLLLGSATQAQPGGARVVQAGVASGGHYHLTVPAWQVAGAARGGDYRLSPAAPLLRGSGCCCTYLPCVLRQFP